jgi:hypothetical protein
LLEGRHDTEQGQGCGKGADGRAGPIGGLDHLTETLTADAAEALHKEVLTDRLLVECGASGDIARSVYTLDFALAKADLEITAHKA